MESTDQHLFILLIYVNLVYTLVGILINNRLVSILITGDSDSLSSERLM